MKHMASGEGCKQYYILIINSEDIDMACTNILVENSTQVDA